MGQPVQTKIRLCLSAHRNALRLLAFLMFFAHGGTAWAQPTGETPKASTTEKAPRRAIEEPVGSLHSGPTPGSEAPPTTTDVSPIINSEEPTKPPVAAPSDVPEISMLDNIVTRARESFVFASVLLILLFLSGMSWFIIFYKWMFFNRLKKASAVFSDAFWKTEKLDTLYEETTKMEPSPSGEMFKAAYEEIVRLQKDDELGDSSSGLARIERTLRRVRMNQNAEMETSLNFLATTGSAAPFIGLFGTVWGIMEAFNHIDPSQNLLTSVAPYIAEALVATAIGLLAAIPAVMAYNYFVRAVRQRLVETDNFAAEFLNLVQRHFFK